METTLITKYLNLGSGLLGIIFLIILIVYLLIKYWKNVKTFVHITMGLVLIPLLLMLISFLLGYVFHNYFHVPLF